MKFSDVNLLATLDDEFLSLDEIAECVDDPNGLEGQVKQLIKNGFVKVKDGIYSLTKVGHDALWDHYETAADRLGQ